MSRWRVGLIVVLMGMVLSQVAAVAEPGSSSTPRLVGSDFQISGTAATSDELFAAVAYNSTDNQYLVVWQDERDSLTRGKDIYGQLLAANGTRIGSEFRISGAAATSDEYDPAVTFNSISRQYLVVWRDSRDFGTRGHEIFGRRVKAGGNLAGDDFRISGTAATANEHAPAVAHNTTNNQYLIVWYDSRDSGTRGSDIYGRRVKAGGNLTGDDFRISGTAATANDRTPAVVYNSTNNQYLAVWQDGRDYGTRDFDIYGRRIKAGGNLTGDDFRISGTAATSDENNPAVAYNSTANQFLIVWDDGRDYGTLSYEVYGRRVKAGGRLAGDDFRISSAATTSNQQDPTVAYSSARDRYLVAWEDARAYGPREWDIYGRRVKAGGSLAGDDFRISSAAATSTEHHPVAAYNSTIDQHLVVWHDSRDAGTRGWDIYGRRVVG